MSTSRRRRLPSTSILSTSFCCWLEACGSCARALTSGSAMSRSMRQPRRAATRQSQGARIRIELVFRLKDYGRMNSGDFKEKLFRVFQSEATRPAPATSEKAPGFRTGEPLDSPRTPYRCQPPESRKVAHYTGLKFKVQSSRGFVY